MSEVLKAIAVTAELTGTELSKAAILAMESDLSAYPPAAVLNALGRCRRELTGRLSPAAVIERIEASDGRPGANEAWGIAVECFDEESTVMLTQEIADALELARPIYEAGDDVGARMAFREAYERSVRGAREQCVAVKWWPSVGSDPARRADAIQLAVDRGLLTEKQAQAYLPAPISGDGAVIAGLLSGSMSVTPSESAMKHLVGLKAILAASSK